MNESDLIPTGTLVRMTPMTDLKAEMIKGHGYLWIVVDHNYLRHRRQHVLKSVATGYVEHFHTEGLEQTDE